MENKKEKGEGGVSKVKAATTIDHDSNCNA